MPDNRAPSCPCGLIADPDGLIMDAPIGTALPSRPDLADDFRNRAYQLMICDPIAATYLVLAAATLAPTCPAEREVADHFSYLVADFALQLAEVHRRARARTDNEAMKHGHSAR